MHFCRRRSVISVEVGLYSQGVRSEEGYITRDQGHSSHSLLSSARDHHLQARDEQGMNTSLES